MSFRDRCWYTLRCAQCDSGETLAVSDQGVCWSGAHWDTGANFLRFDTAWIGGGHLEPELARALASTAATLPKSFSAIPCDHQAELGAPRCAPPQFHPGINTPCLARGAAH